MTWVTSSGASSSSLPWPRCGAVSSRRGPRRASRRARRSSPRWRRRRSWRGWWLNRPALLSSRPLSAPSRSSGCRSSAPLTGGSVREVVLGVSGGIAAYKAADLVRALLRRQAEVTVVLTANARRFITPLTLQTLTGRPAITSAWDPPATGPDAGDVEHIGLARR